MPKLACHRCDWEDVLSLRQQCPRCAETLLVSKDPPAGAAADADPLVASLDDAERALSAARRR